MNLVMDATTMRTIILPFLALPLLLNAQVAATPSPATKSGIQWLTIEQAEARAKKEPRPILVDVYTQWCGPCKMLDRNTFSDPKLAAYVNRKFYAVKFDAESPTPVMYKGKKLENPDYKQELAGRRNGTHHLTYAIANVNGRIAYPTMVYLDNEMNVLAPVQGYMTPQQMEPILNFFGEGHYKKGDYQTFMNGFKAQW